jgi:hypothetical protein
VCWDILRLQILVLLLALLPLTVGAIENPESRKSFAHKMSRDFSRLGLQHVYLPDSCDASGHPNGTDAFFFFTFSRSLAKEKKNPAVVSRAEAHYVLLSNGWTDCDLAKSEVLTRLASALDIDSLLFLHVSSDKGSFSVELSLRDIAGKELSHFAYAEPADAMTLGFFPPTAAPSGWPFYFPGDGVTPPKP